MPFVKEFEKRYNICVGQRKTVQRETENFTLGHEGGLKFSQEVLKSLPGSPRQLFMITPLLLSSSRKVVSIGYAMLKNLKPDKE